MNRHAPTLIGVVVALLGVILIGIGFARTDVEPFHGLRYTALGAMLFTLAAAHLAAVWWVGRADVLRRIYALGYRQGRHDANMQLLEDGIWIASRAEHKANQILPPED